MKRKALYESKKAAGDPDADLYKVTANDTVTLFPSYLEIRYG